MSCEYPEGCPCGVSKQNSLEASLLSAKTKIAELENEILCLNAEKKVCDYSFSVLRRKLDETINHWAALDYNLRHITIKALEEIASYDEGRHDGICPYGCDTPNIAKQALDKLVERAANQS